jgi:hypothetical protein
MPSWISSVPIPWTRRERRRKKTECFSVQLAGGGISPHHQGMMCIKLVDCTLNGGSSIVSACSRLTSLERETGSQSLGLAESTFRAGHPSQDNSINHTDGVPLMQSRVAVPSVEQPRPQQKSDLI